MRSENAAGRSNSSLGPGDRQAAINQEHAETPGPQSNPTWSSHRRHRRGFGGSVLPLEFIYDDPDGRTVFLDTKPPERLY